MIDFIIVKSALTFIPNVTICNLWFNSNKELKRGVLVEKLIRKSAIYGFFIGIGIAILFVKYKVVNNLGVGVTETSYVPVVDYIVTVLRFGVVASFLGSLCVWSIYKK